MSWQTVARTDWSTTIRPRSVKLLLALPAIAIVLAGYLYPILGGETIDTARFAGFATGWFTGLVPLVGVLLGYNAVVSERESGAILLSLSLPQARRDVVFGKLASRVGLLSVSLLASLLLAGALVVYPYGSLEALPFLGFVAVTIAYGGMWTGLGVAASLSVATKRRSLLLAAGLFFLFVIVWEPITTAVESGLRAAGIIGEEMPGLLAFVLSVDPGGVFGRVVDGFIDPSTSLDGPWYLGEWVALALFVLWIVVPLGLAYLRFAGRDLA